jgi:transposase-like protein
MTKRNPFKWRHFEAQIILLCVRWYLRFPLSYRNVEEMMVDRGISIDHTTIYRRVQQYAPEIKREAEVCFGQRTTLTVLMRPI